MILYSNYGKFFRNVDNKALSSLAINCKDTLVWLEIVNCKSITDDGVLNLKDMSRLRILHLEDLKYVKDPKKVLGVLEEANPKCHITYPPYTN